MSKSMSTGVDLAKKGLLQRIVTMLEELEVRGRGLQPLNLIATTSTGTETGDENIRIPLDIKEDSEEEILRSLENWKNLRWKILKTTPGEGDEGFEGPPYRQSLEEDDANDTSENVKSLSKEVEEDDDETLSDKAENRAGRQVIASAVDPVKSDLEKAGTVNTTLEDGVLKAIVAPENEEDSEDTSINKTKARILGPRAEEGKEASKSGYCLLYTSPSPRDS